MSGPNKQYDPVEVAALDPAAIDAGGGRRACRHRGCRLPRGAEGGAAGAPGREERRWRWPTARSAPCRPSAKAEAGKRVGQARGQVGAGARRPARRSSRPSATSGSSSRRPSTSRVRVPRRRLGARHPISWSASGVEDIFVAMGWEIAEGPEVESEWLNFDALNLGADHPARQMQDTFFVDPPELRPGAAHAHLAGAGPHHARQRAADLRALPGQGVPHRRARRHAHPGVPPVRGPRRRRGHHHGAPQGQPRRLRLAAVRRGHA